jgi:UDP-glucose 4-epimerase
VALEGKRIFVSGGAGFIGTTLARELVDRNEIVAYDNLHRDALAGTDLADHPNYELIQGDVLDSEALTDAAQGATHSFTAPRSPASTPCSRARCGRCAST